MAEDDKYLDFDETTKVETKKKLQKPSLYKVLLLNDDYTPMELSLIHISEPTRPY